VRTREHTDALGLDEDRIDPLQTVAHGRERDVLLAALRLQRVELVQRG
jgi:hypothetical protein